MQPRGSSQGGLRQYNERVVLQAIRLHGALPAAEIARLTQLTAQTVSMITKRLIEDGLLVKGSPLRGKVGQPSVPLGLDPEGAFSLGVKVGRRSLDVLLIDFTGQVRERSSLDYPHPEPQQVLQAIVGTVQAMVAGLGTRASRLQGIGMAAPLSLGGWQQLLGYPDDLAERWRDFDLAGEVERQTGLPTALLKDTAAACVAELVAGRGRTITSFLYIFVDTFIGGGLVLDSHLRAGLHGNAGAVGSLPLGLAVTPQGTPPQLLSQASLLTLEARYSAAGLDPSALGDARALQDGWAPVTRVWLQEAARGIALCINSAACLLDLDSVILDGSFSRPLLQALLAELATALQAYSWEGVTPPQVLPGQIGSDARALGGALIPLHANFSPDRGLFLKAAG
ncbi:ROK family transcriptional regulator [Ideonella sp. TBM-1]|uniref:ROK family transcriptional regulator n=1 Tax=Ideonella livida TaxID=2707176 RepID=A0A7C9TMI3_9BURK|nr:ROK family transcriptional regulator [Ideonella livida]NDY92983.1 ROK family transcriptional regulator [Ideonella livida]